MLESFQMLRRGKSAGRLPPWSQEKLVMDLKVLTHTSTRLQQQNEQLKINLQEILETRKETQSFIQEFQQHVSSTSMAHDSHFDSLTIKLKARHLSLRKQCAELDSQINACKKRKRIQVGQHRAFTSECVDIGKIASLPLEYSDKARTLASLYAEHCMMNDKLDQLKNQRERRSLELSIWVNKIKSSAKNRTAIVQSKKPEEIEYELSRREMHRHQSLEEKESYQQIKARIDQKDKALAQINSKIKRLKQKKYQLQKHQQYQLDTMENKLRNSEKIKMRLKKMVENREKVESMQVLNIEGQNLLLQKQQNKHIEHSVSYHEVQAIGAALNLTAMYNRYSTSQLSAILVKGMCKQTTIERLVDRLIKHPFQLQDGQALLLARYIVEDNKYKRIVFDINACAPLPMVRCILQKIVKKVNLRTLSQTRIAWQSLRLVAC